MTLLRITPNKIHAAILYTISALTVLVGAMFLLVSIFECTPVDYFWNRLTKSGTCIDPNALVGIAYTASVVAAIADFILGLLPCFIIWNLQMNRRTKIALAGIMGLGCMLVFPAKAITMNFPLTLQTVPVLPSSSAYHTYPPISMQTSYTPPMQCPFARISRPAWVSPPALLRPFAQSSVSCATRLPALAAASGPLKTAIHYPALRITVTNITGRTRPADITACLQPLPVVSRRCRMSVQRASHRCTRA